MNLPFFTNQMLRMKSEWANSFGPERQSALWDIFKDVPDEVFKMAVTRLILNGTAYPPKLKDFEEQVELARTRWKEQQYDKQQQQHGIPPAEDTKPTPARLAMVHNYVQQIVKGMGIVGGDKVADTEGRKQELRDQLTVVSGRDRAAGVEREEE